MNGVSIAPTGHERSSLEEELSVDLCFVLKGINEPLWPVVGLDSYHPITMRLGTYAVEPPIPPRPEDMSPPPLPSMLPRSPFSPAVASTSRTSASRELSLGPGPRAGLDSPEAWPEGRPVPQARQQKGAFMFKGLDRIDSVLCQYTGTSPVHLRCRLPWHAAVMDQGLLSANPMVSTLSSRRNFGLAR